METSSEQLSIFLLVFTLWKPVYFCLSQFFPEEISLFWVLCGSFLLLVKLGSAS